MHTRSSSTHHDRHGHGCNPAAATAMLEANPIPSEPKGLPELHITHPSTLETSYNQEPTQTLSQSGESSSWSSDRSSISEAASTPKTEPPQIDEVIEEVSQLPAASVAFDRNINGVKTGAVAFAGPRQSEDITRLLGPGHAGTQLIERYCCGGGCCQLEKLPTPAEGSQFVPVTLPDNAAYHCLQLRLGPLAVNTPLSNVAELPDLTVSFEPAPVEQQKAYSSSVYTHPPEFVQPHPPYQVFSAPVFHARELTKPGAEKRTFHFDLDVTDYPDEGGVDFKVGGAIGICPPNSPELVDDLFNILGVPNFVRDKAITLRTTGGRWPTIWGEEEARTLLTTRRELLTWCSDLQSTPPTKPLLRLLAEYADSESEKQILMYLTSAQGQAAFCDLRTGPHITVNQLLHAFPSSKPPLHALLSVLKQLMPRFYSLSNDPHVSSSREGLAGRRLIEMAVTVHETPDWSSPEKRTGVGSGFLERIAQQYIEARGSGVTSAALTPFSTRPASPSPAGSSTDYPFQSSTSSPTSDTQTPFDSTAPAAAQLLNIRIPMFRGLMANPLSREFISDGPMMLIGAGVGMAPFRGFILNRLKNANCANKIWLVQGVRDSNLDELYQGELGAHESEIKKVVQSRAPKKQPSKEEIVAGIAVEAEAKYVQDEVRQQADVVWHVINANDGRVFVCGSSKGMGEGVYEALIEVVMKKGGLNRVQAEEFWEQKKADGQYIAETW